VPSVDLSSALPFDTAISTRALPNGLRYFVRRDPASRNTARNCASLVVNVGSVLEDVTAGVAHFVEHMAFNGTKRFPKNQIGRLHGIDRHALWSRL
jgi:zinc protease